MSRTPFHSHIPHTRSSLLVGSMAHADVKIAVFQVAGHGYRHVSETVLLSPIPLLPRLLDTRATSVWGLGQPLSLLATVVSHLIQS